MKYFVLSFFLFASSAVADERKPDLNAPEFSNCTWYRSKKNNVPVYAGPSTTSEVIDRAQLGEEVCYIGEENRFAILQWDRQALLRGKPKEEKERRGFIRLVELWEPDSSKRTVSQESQETWKFQQKGITPDDPIWFLRPLLNLFYSQDPCADSSRIGCNQQAP